MVTKSVSRCPVLQHEEVSSEPITSDYDETPMEE